MTLWWRGHTDGVGVVPPTPAGTGMFHLPLESSEVRLVRWCQWGILAITVGMLCLAGWWGWESQALQETAERYEAVAARSVSLNQSFAAQMQRDGLILTPDQIAAARMEVAFANQLTDKRTFSWTRLLSDLEETVPPEVSIASIKLNFQESAVVLEGMAQRLQDLNRFVHQLQQHRAFRQAVLSKHEFRHEATGKAGVTANQSVTSDEVETERVIEYSLTVLYRPML